MPSPQEIAAMLVKPPNKRPMLVKLEPGAAFGSYEIQARQQRIILLESDLTQLFDLLAAHFDMHVERPLNEFLGFWDERAYYGPDPRPSADALPERG